MPGVVSGAKGREKGGTRGQNPSYFLKKAERSATAAEPTPPLSAPLRRRGLHMSTFERSTRINSPLERGGPPQAGRGVLNLCKKKRFSHIA